MKRLRSNFSEANRNIKNDTIDNVSKDDSMKETLHGHILGMNDSKVKQRS